MYESLEREIYVDARPEVVFDVVSRPEHVSRWWPDDADYDPAPGGTGRLVFGTESACQEGGEEPTAVAFQVVEADPHTRFAFRWTHPAGDAPVVGNSLLVTFDLTPEGTGTRLRLRETGFDVMEGWDDEAIEREFRDHESGWDHYLPRIRPYAESVAVRS